MLNDKRAWVLSAISSILLSLFIAGVSSAATTPDASSGYKLLKTIPLPDEGTWDFVAIEEGLHRLYIGRETHVQVLDAKTGGVVGVLPNTPGVHGVAFAPEFGRGFTSNGGSNTVTIFDLKSLETLTTVKTGEGPGPIAYDRTSKLIFVENDQGKSVTVIKAMEGTVVATIALPEEPAFVIADDLGHVYVILDNPSEIALIDTTKLSVSKRITLPHCTEPTTLAIDQETHRLFVACRNETLMVLNPDDGKVIARIVTGGKVEGIAVDANSQLAFSASGVGTISVIRKESPNQYSVVDTVLTKRGARNLALDPTTHLIYLVTGELLPPEKNQKKPTAKAGSAVLLIVGKA